MQLAEGHAGQKGTWNQPGGSLCLLCHVVMHLLTPGPHIVSDPGAISYCHPHRSCGDQDYGGFVNIWRPVFRLLSAASR